MRIKPKNIMCAIDFSEFTHITLSHGIALAKELGANLNVCHIVPAQVMMTSHSPSYMDFGIDETQRITHARNRLETLLKEVDFPVNILVSSGHAADEINYIAAENKIDLVIATTHGGSGFKRFLIGSVTDRLLKTLSCPLLVLHVKEKHFVNPENQHIHLKKILVGCDFSLDSQLAFEYGLSLAQEFETELHLAHVLKYSDYGDVKTADSMLFKSGDTMRWNSYNYQEMIQTASMEQQEAKGKLLSRLEAQLLNMIPESCRYWCNPEIALLEGEPYQVLINYAEQKHMDLIVLGIHGHSLLEQFLVGTTTDRVVSRASTAVLAVRQKA